MENSTPPITPKLFLKTITIIHFALVAGVLIFGFAIFSITENQKLDLNYSEDVMFFVVPIIALAGIFASDYLYRNSLKASTSKNTLREKLTVFQTASLIKYALLEGPALLGLVAFMNNGNQYFLIISLIMLIWLILQRPTRDRIERDLMLNGSLKNEFAQEDRPMT